MDIENKITSKIKNFHEKIEEIVASKKIPYLDAIVYYAEKNNLEIETVSEYIIKNDFLKSKLEIEAEELNFLPKSNRLPV